MNVKGWLYWLYERGKNYNLFLPEIEDYQDNENERRENDHQTILKYQKYTTRLYIILLLGKFKKKKVTICVYIVDVI